MATVHDHQLHKGQSLADAAQRAFERAGEQWTPMRAEIFSALSAAAKPASAYDLAETVSASTGRRVAANSVYRILDVFVAANLARRVESANAYIVNAHPECEHDCIFLVCDSCGQASHVDNDDLTGSVRRAAEKAGFTNLRPVIEVRGCCAICSEGDAA
ncbi:MULTISPECIES: Fur family transcriptional regulator [unclassified Sphingomonas]|uniref:Fur family transcriptional regulator n=1 Tax=unclassified Sphingomonas TaxID=196159 RepID=UPI00070039FE|nr:MULTISPECIES: transcriptional repressor [unclassified Sphingomonas]KQX26282.1 Fur family transcriptional regulator [Sphingomonas sp. Root1294]KQY69351.1 Fur family transcriptional regulator [Sphingomonas sp. Root50]KRB89610.1 Fur family transcriptional regulator [Sphingomonas sp. Root720]